MSEASESLNSPGFPAAGGDFFSPAYLERRRRAIESAEAAAGFQGIDQYDPTLPSGHAYAIRKSTSLTSYTKLHQRKAAMDIAPQAVIDALVAAGVKNWVLMGLHGYVGNMPSPRATQDVNVMVPYSERSKAKKAIAARWPVAGTRDSRAFTSHAVSRSAGPGS